MITPFRSLTIILLALTGRLTSAQAVPLCPYDQCALRLEGSRVFRGVGSEAAVGRLGVWSGPRLLELVGAVDSARPYAMRFDANYNVGARLTFAGALLLAPVVVDALRGSYGTMRREHQLYLSISGLTMVLIGGAKQRTAHDALSRALWWYNRQLPR